MRSELAESHGFVERLTAQIGDVRCQLDAAFAVFACVILGEGDQFTAEMLTSEVFPDGNAETGV